MASPTPAPDLGQGVHGRVYALTGVKGAIYVSPASGRRTPATRRGSPTPATRSCGSPTGRPAPAPTVPADNWGGNGWTFWQYTSSGTVTGISGRVDLDRYRFDDLGEGAHPLGRDSVVAFGRSERSHRGLVQRFAKPPCGVTCIEGSNPSLSATRGAHSRSMGASARPLLAHAPPDYPAGMAAAVRLSLLLASLGWLAACGAPTSSGTPVSSPIPLDLQVRNSGLPGGYVWLSIPGQPSQSRWHRFGMATFICVTCPEPFVGSGSGYEIAVLDASCAVRGRYRVDGGPLLVEIDLGPTLQDRRRPAARRLDARGLASH